VGLVYRKKGLREKGVQGGGCSAGVKKRPSIKQVAKEELFVLYWAENMSVGDCGRKL